jgi:enolase
MPKIQSLFALEILDSRGIPTIQVECLLDSGAHGSFKVPSGASTGEHEALELRDHDPKRYFGKGVLKAVSHVNDELARYLKGMEVSDYKEIDQKMIDFDGTPNKSRLGANALLGCSIAIFKALAMHHHLPCYRFLGHYSEYLIPTPMMNVINGGLHADNSLDFQELMIRPKKAKSFSESLRMGAEVFYQLKKLLKSHHYNTSVGDEGGFAPDFPSLEAALDYLILSIKEAGYVPHEEISIALDCAASSFFDKDKKSYFELKKKMKKEEFQFFSKEEQIGKLKTLIEKYPIDSIEDGLEENDFMGFSQLTKEFGPTTQIVGDDLFVTNPEFLKKGIELKACNAILIKLNQIGTLKETIETIELAKKHHYKTIISHRSGETEDDFIADLAVGTQAGQIKTGSLSRSERISKYNRLLKIEHELKDKAKFS